LVLFGYRNKVKNMINEPELLKQRKEVLDDLNDFYARLPDMSAPDIISEYQQKVRNLIDYIIALEKGYRDA